MGNLTLRVLLTNLAHTQSWILKNKSAPYSVIAHKQIQMSLIIDDIRSMGAYQRPGSNVIRFPARIRVVPTQPEPPRAA